jgi:hypothetical protein
MVESRLTFRACRGALPLGPILKLLVVKLRGEKHAFSQHRREVRFVVNCATFDLSE